MKVLCITGDKDCDCSGTGKVGSDGIEALRDEPAHLCNCVQAADTEPTLAELVGEGFVRAARKTAK